MKELIFLFFKEFVGDGGIAFAFTAVDADFTNGQEPEIGLIEIDYGMVEGVVEDVGDGQILNLRVVLQMDFLALSGGNDGRYGVDEILLTIHGLKFGIRVL